MSTPYTAVDFNTIYESAQGYLNLANDIDRVKTDLDDSLPDPKEAFGDDEYGRKAIPNIVQGKQEGDDLFTSVKSMIGGAGHNLVITAQSFDNANNVNEGLVPSSNPEPQQSPFNPSPQQSPGRRN